MLKIAIILLAAPDTPEGTGRMANALTTTQEFQEAGDDVRLMFDGAGVTWVPRLTDADEKYFRLFEAVRPVVSLDLAASADSGPLAVSVLPRAAGPFGAVARA